MAPLADQVRFVDDEQPRPPALERLPGLRVRQLLRGQEDERARVARGRAALPPAPRPTAAVPARSPATRPPAGARALSSCSAISGDRTDGLPAAAARSARRWPTSRRRWAARPARRGRRAAPDRAELPGMQPLRAEPLPCELLDHGSAGRIVTLTHVVTGIRSRDGQISFRPDPNGRAGERIARRGPGAARRRERTDADAEVAGVVMGGTGWWPAPGGAWRRRRLPAITRTRRRAGAAGRAGRSAQSRAGTAR